MKVKYMGETDSLTLIHGKVYEVISVEKGPGEEDWYRIVDETQDDYLYHCDNFEIVDDDGIQ